MLNAPLFADLTGPVGIGDNVTIGHHAVFITTYMSRNSGQPTAFSNRDSVRCEARAAALHRAPIQQELWIGSWAQPGCQRQGCVDLPERVRTG